MAAIKVIGVVLHAVAYGAEVLDIEGVARGLAGRGFCRAAGKASAPRKVAVKPRLESMRRRERYSECIPEERQALRSYSLESDESVEFNKSGRDASPAGVSN